MKNNRTYEIIITTCLVVLAILLLNPFHFWMPTMIVVGILVLAVVAFGFFASFILRETSQDERENVHKTIAGRNAFLVGSAVLMLGVIVQGYTHTVDAWLVIALVMMIVVKLATRIWTDRNF